MAKQQNKGFLLRLDPETMELVERWAAQNSAPSTVSYNG